MQPSEVSMKFFSGFQWAVPTAFSDSVSKAWFVEGDVLYDHLAAYDSDWNTAIKSVQHTIQVRSPARSSGIGNQSTREVFSRNWATEVKIDLYLHMKRVSPLQITTTQGRLYVALWKGRVDTLFVDKVPHPNMPISAHQTSKNLKEVSSVATGIANGHPTFVMVRDFSNGVSREKFEKVLTVLRSHMNQDPVILTPSEAKMIASDEIAPTVEIAVFPTKGLDSIQLETLVKHAVYVPGKDAKRDMFRLGTHGMIV
jgi:hypothetical protein